LGSQCEGAHCVSFRARQHGQEHFVDFSARRRLLQPAARRDECRASDAAEARAGGKPEDYSPACGDDAGFDHHYSTRGAGCRLRACVQSVDRIGGPYSAEPASRLPSFSYKVLACYVGLQRQQTTEKKDAHGNSRRTFSKPALP